jgi:hypothetical protein
VTTGGNQGYGPNRHDAYDEIKAYDALPAEIRKAVREARIPIGCGLIRALLRRAGDTPAARHAMLRAIAATEARALAELAATYQAGAA